MAGKPGEKIDGTAFFACAKGKNVSHCVFILVWKVNLTF
jgi:hypothetical protein